VAKKKTAKKRAVKGAKKTAKKRAVKGKKKPAKLKANERDLMIVPVRNMILFPGVVLPLMVGRERSIVAIQTAVQGGQEVGLLLQIDEQEETPGTDDLYDVGTVAEIVRYWTAPDGRHHAICQGAQRFRIKKFTQTEPFLIARVELIKEIEPETKAIEARFVALRHQALEVLQMAPGSPEDLGHAIQGIESPSMLADMVATFMDVPAYEKQQVLEAFDLKERLDRITVMLGEMSAVLKLSNKIRQKTKSTLDKAQREYYLREQLRAIQKELGEGDEHDEEFSELRDRLYELDLPEEARKVATKELRRLERMPEQSSEYSMMRTYLETFADLPWATLTKDNLNLRRARRVLNEDHYGLEKVKRRILEFLAVRKLNPTGQGPTLCLVGPPGVGKTSLGHSIARALDRKFERISLGGVHDEAEIRGHRRTYVGAMPGAIVAGLLKVGSKNPVFMLDELDKLGSGIHGDPSSALLEVLDPAQNHTFRDHYLGADFDLRSVLFIGTANVLHEIPRALRDRLEVIHLPGYSAVEKLEIAKRYLVKRRLKATGLKRSQCRIQQAALRLLIKSYTREAGVRNLEREIGAICRHVAMKVAEGKAKSVSVGAADLAAILGPARYESELALRTSQAGVVTGLAWTPVGGEILFVEASSVPGKGKLILTGHLGAVMKESAIAAISLAKARAEQFGISAGAFDKIDLHLHIPAGAVPKDGPSAGAAMFTAVVSLLTGRRAQANIAMTGEISLRGLVLPIGGVKEKVLAAHAAGVKKVLLPARNKRDFKEIPAEARKKLRFVWVENVDQVIAAALERAGAKKPLPKKLRLRA
jgi:ATP-dependent Lon protease